jgi:hypothetical protein
MKQFARIPLAALIASMASVGSIAHAGMSNTATTFGILPSDIASAQSLSLFNNQVSATYYNPA